MWFTSWSSVPHVSGGKHSGHIPWPGGGSLSCGRAGGVKLEGVTGRAVLTRHSAGEEGMEFMSVCFMVAHEEVRTVWSGSQMSSLGDQMTMT